MENISSSQNVQISSEGMLVRILRRYPVILQILKFGAIGVINTALDFLILNVISETLKVSSGLKLGGINIIGFILAMVQSYYWNKSWAFNTEEILSLWKNFWRLVAIGFLGFAGMVMVFVGAKLNAPASLYAVVLILFVVFEVVLWEMFKLSKVPPSNEAQKQFVAFVVVSIIGLLINSGLVALLSTYSPLAHNPETADLNKNVAKLAATFASLVWNFLGYKIFVFKK